MIRDAQSNAFESERFYLEYKDPAFSWQRIQRGDLKVLWHDRPSDGVVKVAEDVSRRLEPVKRLLGLDTLRPMKAVILNSRREAGTQFSFYQRNRRGAPRIRRVRLRGPGTSSCWWVLAATAWSTR